MSRRCKRTSMQPLFISLDYLGVSALPLSTNLIFWFWNCSYSVEGPCVSMSYVVGLPINSYKPITNTAWVIDFIVFNATFSNISAISW
jgi:hypothetical protein